MIMNLFFRELYISEKRRVHFHEFMHEFHQKTKKIRNNRHKDPIKRICNDIAKEKTSPLACFQLNDAHRRCKIKSSLFFIWEHNDSIPLLNDSDFVLSISTNIGTLGDRLAVFVDNIRKTLHSDFTVNNTTLTFTIAPHSGKIIDVGRINKRYYNNDSDKFQQYTFDNNSINFLIFKT